MIMNNEKSENRDQSVESGVDPAVELEQHFKSEDPDLLQSPSDQEKSDRASRQALIAHQQGGAVAADLS